MLEQLTTSPTRRSRRRTPVDSLITEVPTKLSVRAYHLFETLRLKPVRSLLGNRVTSSSSHEVQVQYGPFSYLFVYRFGCLVFVNVPKKEAQKVIEQFKTSLPEAKKEVHSESYEVFLGEAPLVEFEFTRLSQFKLNSLRIISLIVAQSAALEYFEKNVDQMLEASGAYIQNLSKHGRVPFFRGRQLLKMIGSTAATRQEILSRLSVLDSPEETWNDEALETLHNQLKENFELELRSKILEKKLSLIQDNIELLADIISTNKGLFLELLIVALICLEIIAGLFKILP